MGTRTFIKSKHGNSRQIKTLCFLCNKTFYESPASYAKKKRHFCSTLCYALFRKVKMLYHEQPAYKGVRKKGQSKQIYHRRYCKNHPENISHLKARRYAREKGALGSHTRKEWENIKGIFGNKCALCRKDGILTKDHIIPLSKGGTDFSDNIQPLCRSCNSRKWKFIYENPELLKG